MSSMVRPPQSPRMRPLKKEEESTALLQEISLTGKSSNQLEDELEQEQDIVAMVNSKEQTKAEKLVIILEPVEGTNDVRILSPIKRKKRPSMSKVNEKHYRAVSYRKFQTYGPDIHTSYMTYTLMPSQVVGRARLFRNQDDEDQFSRMTTYTTYRITYGTNDQQETTRYVTKFRKYHIWADDVN